MPLEAREINFNRLTLEDLLDDLAAHPRAHVAWALDRAYIPKFEGTLDPLSLSGPLTAETRDFEAYDKPHLNKYKRKMMGVDRGTVSGTCFRRLSVAG